MKILALMLIVGSLLVAVAPPVATAAVTCVWANSLCYCQSTPSASCSDSSTGMNTCAYAVGLDNQTMEGFLCTDCGDQGACAILDRLPDPTRQDP